MRDILNVFQLQLFQLLFHLLQDKLGIERGFISRNMDIDPKKEEYENTSKEFDDIMFLFGTEDMEKTLGHNYGRIMTYDCEYILYPFVDTHSDSGVDSLIIELHRTRKWRESESSVRVLFIRR